MYSLNSQRLKNVYVSKNEICQILKLEIQTEIYKERIDTYYSIEDIETYISRYDEIEKIAFENFLECTSHMHFEYYLGKCYVSEERLLEYKENKFLVKKITLRRSFAMTTK